MRVRGRVAGLRRPPRRRWSFRLPDGDWLEQRTLLAASPLELAVPLHFGAFNDAQVSHFLSIPDEVDLYSVTLQSGETLDASIDAQQAGSGLDEPPACFRCERHAAGARQPAGGRPATDLPGGDRRHLLHRRQQRPQQQLQSDGREQRRPRWHDGAVYPGRHSHDVGAAACRI